jgi:hypothetical protein
MRKLSEAEVKERCETEEGVSVNNNGAKIVCVVILVALGALAANVYAGLHAAEYGMTVPDLRRELWMALFYGIVGAVAFILVGRSRRMPPGMILFARLVIALATFALIKSQMAYSLELAPIKQEFARAAEKCRVVARGEMDCGNNIAKVLAKRDKMLEDINVIMYGDWQVIAPRPQTREVRTDALYFPSL